MRMGLWGIDGNGHAFVLHIAKTPALKWPKPLSLNFLL